MKKIGVYIHIPFCKSKCFYCDFNSYQNKICLVDDYIEAIQLEIEKYNLKKYEIETIYIGGGTPSFIDEKYIEKVLSNINISSVKEITIEVNPRNCYIRKIEKILFNWYK